MEIPDIEHYDPNDLARELQRTWKQQAELAEYERFIKETLAQKALKQKDKTISTQYGTFLASWRQPYRTWDVDRLAQEIFVLAKRGELHDLDHRGNLPGTPEWRIFDAIRRFFTLEPRIGEVKKAGLSVEEYSSTKKDGYWSVSKPSKLQ